MKFQKKIKNTCVKLIVPTVLSALGINASSQTKPVNFVLGTYAPENPLHNYNILGFGPNSGTNFHNTRYYNV